MAGVSPLGQVSRTIVLAELDRKLEGYPTVDQLLGPHLRALAAEHTLTEDLLPDERTESDLGAIAAGVEGLVEHWRQSLGPKTRERLFTALAEIEGYWLLLNSGFEHVYALRPRGRQRTPDACCWRARRPFLFEFKSLWAFIERRRYNFRSLPTGVIVFGGRPAGRSVREALTRFERVNGLRMPDPEYNALVLDLTICNLLRSGTAQLSTYATREQRPHPRLLS
jgi:hypothetical protein